MSSIDVKDLLSIYHNIRLFIHAVPRFKFYKHVAGFLVFGGSEKAIGHLRNLESGECELLYTPNISLYPYVRHICLKLRNPLYVNMYGEGDIELWKNTTFHHSCSIGDIDSVKMIYSAFDISDDILLSQLRSICPGISYLYEIINWLGYRLAHILGSPSFSCKLFRMWVKSFCLGISDKSTTSDHLLKCMRCITSKLCVPYNAAVRRDIFNSIVIATQYKANVVALHFIYLPNDEYKITPREIEKIMNVACIYGNIGVAKFINKDMKTNINMSYSLHLALSNNHIDIAKYLYEDRTTLSNYEQKTVDAMSTNGYNRALAYTFEHFPYNYDLNSCICKAYIHGKIDTVKYLESITYAAEHLGSITYVAEVLK